jgi:2-polyprenyl-3-methyl-5-hydroxy-6-metoxy-1,4-benzoquinol methylase
MQSAIVKRQEVSLAVQAAAGRHRRRWIFAAAVACLAVTTVASKLGTTAAAAFGYKPRLDCRVPVRKHARSSTTSTSSTALSAKGFGASKKTSSSETSNGKSILKRLPKKYGGTSPQDIAAGTQRLVEQALGQLPPHMQLATRLYQQLRQWNATLSIMSLLDQTNLPLSSVQGSQRAQAELTRLLLEHNVTEVQLHNIFQQVTWDASADAKTARALTSAMSLDIAARVERAIDFVAAAMVDDDASSRRRRCLDVGCGFGTLVPMLTRKGVVSSQIYGIDLSPQMIRNAQELYSDCHFVAGDFLQYQPTDKDHDPESGDGGYFDAILFCSALHDLPDPSRALAKATSLLRLGGSIVIVHAQGARHVQQQVQANPVLVRRGLPDVDELRTMASNLNLELVVEPAPPNTPRDVGEGYLAVLTKI